MRLAAAVLAVLAVAACSSSPAPAPWGKAVLTPDPQAIANQPVLERGASAIELAPISPTGAAIGVDYDYVMPHCGIHSPIDVDGSFWDPVDVAPDSVAFDGQPGVFRLVDHVTATFTTASGLVLNLVRHGGPQSFSRCA